MSAMSVNLLRALAADTAALPYDAVASKLDAFQAIPEAERDRLDLVTRIVSARAPTKAISLFMVIGTQRFCHPARGGRVFRAARSAEWRGDDRD
jgi:hypothetical protein